MTLKISKSKGIFHLMLRVLGEELTDDKISKEEYIQSVNTVSTLHDQSLISA